MICYDAFQNDDKETRRLQHLMTSAIDRAQDRLIDGSP